MPNVIRVSMFKIPAQHVQNLLAAYEVLVKTAVKDGKPYILSLQAGPAHDDPRSQGFNVIAKSEFKDMADMKFYDTECAAHKALKASAKAWIIEPIMTVYYEPQVIIAL